MNRIIIACGTLHRELSEVMELCGCTDPVIWLTAGAHNVPQKRQEEIRKALEKCGDYDTVLLAMSFCGNALVGMESGEHTLVLPRFDDCLYLLRGGRSRPLDTYYLSEGWLRGRENLLTEYETAQKKYGGSRADRIFSGMLRNYRHMVWLGTLSSLPDRVQQFASRFSLELSTETPNLALMVKLLQGRWDSDFLILPPQSKIKLEMRNGGISDA